MFLLKKYIHVNIFFFCKIESVYNKKYKITILQGHTSKKHIKYNTSLFSSYNNLDNLYKIIHFLFSYIWTKKDAHFEMHIFRFYLNLKIN